MTLNEAAAALPMIMLARFGAVLPVIKSTSLKPRTEAALALTSTTPLRIASYSCSTSLSRSTLSTCALSYSSQRGGTVTNNIVEVRLALVAFSAVSPSLSLSSSVTWKANLKNITPPSDMPAPRASWPMISPALSLTCRCSAMS